MSDAPPQTPPEEDYIFLVGHTPLKQFLDFMTTEPVDAPSADIRQLADDWRAADAYLRSLQIAEARIADRPPVLPLPPAFEPQIGRLLADPFFQRSFAHVPVDVGVVELDRLVVRQKGINLAHVERLKACWGPDPDDEAIFSICLPTEPPALPPCRIATLPDGSFDIVSVSNDLRLLETLVLRPEQLARYTPHGSLAGVVAAIVGFGTNCLNVLAAEGRLILHNGSHRSCALRDLGIKHAPCVIQKITSRHELDVIAGGALRRVPDLYLTHPRPPLLKDYFDPRLRRIVRLPRAARHVRVRLSVEQIDMPLIG
jgi:hypothetical protein